MYLGNSPTQQAFTPAVDVFSGNGSTTAFTLSRPVASVAQVQAFIENVPQSPVDAFTVSGNTITFTSAPPSGSSNIYVRYTSPITQVMQPTDGSVGTNQLAANAVTAAKVASGQVFGLNGVAFPASQVASADPNTLDDYEEGTFTPTLYGATTAGTPVSGAGYYTKVGNSIKLTIRFENFAKPSGAVGSAIIGGLPFAISGTSTCFSRGGLGLVFTNGGTSLAGQTWSLRDQSLTEFRIQYQSNVNANVSDLDVSNLAATGNYVRLDPSYLV